MGTKFHGCEMGLGPTPSQLSVKSYMLYQPSEDVLAKIQTPADEFYVQKFSATIESMQTQIDNLNARLKSVEFLWLVDILAKHQVYCCPWPFVAFF